MQMSYPKRKLKLLALLVVCLLFVAIAGFFVIKKLSPVKTTGPTGSHQTASNTNNQGQSTPQPTQPANGSIRGGAADFSYQSPAGWADMSKQVLDASGAASGISHQTSPTATFTIKVSNAIPKDTNDLKNSTLNELKKFSNFALIANVDTNINGKTGQKFTYTFSDKNGNNKVKQEINVVVYNQKTFFLLFSSSESDFAKQSADFPQILSNSEVN